MTPKQSRFVEEYLKDLCASAAYKRAGYAARGNAAEVNGILLLRNTQVAKAIRDAQARRSKRLEISADRVVREAARLAFSDLRDLVAVGGDEVTIKPSAEWSDDAAAAVESVRAQGDSVSIRLAPKTRAIELLARLLGFLKDGPKEGDTSSSDKIVEALDRIAQAGGGREAILALRGSPVIRNPANGSSDRELSR